MRIRFHTASGSMYVVDSEKMTWERVSNHDIPSFNQNEGKLAVFPVIAIGLPCYFLDRNPSREFMPEGLGIQTTQVVRAELI